MEFNGQKEYNRGREQAEKAMRDGMTWEALAEEVQMHGCQDDYDRGFLDAALAAGGPAPSDAQQ